MKLKKKHYSVSYYKTQLEDKRPNILIMVRPYLSICKKNNFILIFTYQMHSELVVLLIYFIQHLMGSISLGMMLLENTVQTSTDWMFVCLWKQVAVYCVCFGAAGQWTLKCPARRTDARDVTLCCDPAHG